MLVSFSDWINENKGINEQAGAADELAKAVADLDANIQDALKSIDLVKDKRIGSEKADWNDTLNHCLSSLEEAAKKSKQLKSMTIA